MGLVVLANSLHACGGAGSGGITGRYGPLTFDLVTNKTAYTRGEAVIYTFTVTNTTNRNVAVTLGSPGSEDNPLHTQDTITKNGVDVWSTGGGGGNLGVLTIGPNEVVNHIQNWNQLDTNNLPLGSGSYKHLV